MQRCVGSASSLARLFEVATTCSYTSIPSNSSFYGSSRSYMYNLSRLFAREFSNEAESGPKLPRITKAMLVGHLLMKRLDLIACCEWQTCNHCIGYLLFPPVRNRFGAPHDLFRSGSRTCPTATRTSCAS